jgi:periplasmic protein TonB
MGTAAELSRIQPASHEQRLSVRKRLSGPIPIQLFPDQEVLLSEVSEGGLSVTASSRLDVGAVAQVSFQLPETDSDIDATVAVAWSDISGRAGIRFTSLEPHSTATLSRWLVADATVIETESPAEPSTDSALTAKIAGLREVADLKTAMSLQQLDRDASLETIVSRMAHLTRASGAAIALREGPDVVCRASFGNAPDIGVKLSAASLSGECLRRCDVVLLEDSESDARVDPEICRRLNFRSLLIVPIISGSETVGIAEVLSPEPCNFESSDILVLSFIADLVAGVAVQNAEIQEPAVTNMFDVASQNLAAMDDQAIEIPTSAVSIDGSERIFVPEVPPALEPRRTATPENGNFTKPAMLQDTVLRSASVLNQTRSYAKAVATSNAPAVRVFSPGIQRRRAIPMLPIAIVAAVLLLVVVLLSGNFLRGKFNSPSPANGTTGIPAGATQPVVAASPAAAPAIAAERSTTASAATKPRPGSPRPNVAAAESHDSNSTNRSLDEVAVVQRPSGSANPTLETAPEAPVVNQLTARSNAMLPASIIGGAMPTPELSPLTPIQSQGVTEGKLVKKVLPRYPEMARRAGVAGDVVISATITMEGTLRNLRVMSGSPLLREEAVSAARQWRYSPYKLGGKPVETETRITVSFHR